MTVIIVIIAAFCIPLALLLVGGQSRKRGCGRGCSTCGNRHICHRGKYKENET